MIEYMNNLDNNDIVLYTVTDIQKMFNFGRTKAYELLAADGFPSFKINNRVYVEREQLLFWLNKRVGKKFSF